MNIDNLTYQESLKDIILQNNELWNYLKEKSILVTGASGLIGSCLIDVLMKVNELYNEENINVMALGRNEIEAKERFAKYDGNKYFSFIKQDVIEEINLDEKSDFIIHAASSAHPIAYAKEPVNTVLGNIIGVNNLLKYAVKNKTQRLLFISSGEIYGQGDENIKNFEEEYRGYINNMNVRAGYPISKQAAENLCVAYSEQYNIETVVVRPCHIYGPTLTAKDSRAFAQFLRNGIEGKDIVLKSKGEQLRSYCYVIDCAIGILYALVKGENKNAYNIANSNSNVRINELANTIANVCNVNVVYDIPDEIEKKGYNPVTQSVLDSKKIGFLGWEPQYDIHRGIQDTVKILTNNSII